jgi:flavin reductase (DIM6/NTAB) family NADH-FMN oxidoreductase RutF
VAEQPETDTEQAFNAIVGELDYPMLVVTVAAGEEIGGCLIGFATQSSISPPRFLICLSEKNRTTRLAVGSELLGVHFLSREDDDLAELFGGETGDEVDKFERVDWTPGPGGTPLLERCRNRFVGRVRERLDAGDHVAILLAPIEAEHGEAVRPFPFHRAKRLDPGHEA